MKLTHPSGHTGEIATVESTTLGYEGHGILSCYLGLKTEDGGVSVGGHALDIPIFQTSTGEYVRSRPGGEENLKCEFIGRFGSAYGMTFVKRLIDTLGVESWEKLVGQKCIALFDGSMWGSRSIGVAHLTDSKKFFIFSELRDEVLELGLERDS